MRLRSVFISQYKNLKDFKLRFDGASFIDVFVGKNGSGKSNLFEALIEIFRHLDQLGRADNNIDFDYKLNYEIGGQETEIEWKSSKLRINQDEDRKTLGQTPFPDNVLIYYSGHNTTVTGLVAGYEEAFRRRIKGANLDDTRRFIGIGPEYKSLLLAVLLAQPEDVRAHLFIRQKLGIDKLGITKPGTDNLTEPVLRIEFQRPEYARGKKVFDIELNDETDRYWKADGITKTFLDTLSNCRWGNTEGLPVTEGYFQNGDRYVLILSISKLQQEFHGKWQDLFRQFDNLKTLGMLDSISVPLRLASGGEGNITHFSDGQFQSVYIYSIVELFKDRNCLILLDEPDAFLHPEWQFDFLRQVFDITDTAAKSSHVLMSSHSASTITCAKESVINLFAFDGDKVTLTKVNKADVIKSLSAGLITFTESEARLNIQHVLKNTSGPVLFTEGITDEMILETAWTKLYPTEKICFEIQNAFSCGFQRNLIKDNTLYQNHPGRTFFSLFDFDEAYNDWNQLGQDVQTDPGLCLVKKRSGCESYALLLPVPTNGQIRKQVINPHTGGNYGNRSLLTIELLFHGIAGLDAYFTVDTERTDGFIKFVSDSQKVTFARDVVPTIDVVHFAVFRPLFDFIKSKCVGGVTP
ncbi:AAA family ATPase [Methylomonas paludis]|uniref:AAA family ATPase n=1 Tax=Methylomonas paludis TaxID=1173101 RepID=A0A975MMX8_9GAMM|nr:AAA family ATPase [Methylomonas paludis]QWF70574.1 AAA family ATPase [Methylomonas paludis]